MKKLSRLWKADLGAGVKASFVYVFANVISKALGIITLPVFTRIISAEQIGIINLYSSWFALASEAAVLSLTSGGLTLCLKKYSNERDGYCSSITFFTTMISAVLWAVFFVCPDLLTSFTGLPRNLIIMMLIGLLCNPAYNIWLARNRYEFKYKIVGMVTVLSAVVPAMVSILAVIYAKRSGFQNLGEVRLISNNVILYGIYLIIYIHLLLKGRKLIDTDYWKFSLSLSLPLMAHQIASQILSVSDRAMISRFADNADVGIYSTIYSLASVSAIVWSSITTAYVPFLYENIDNSKKHKQIIYITYSIIALFGVIVVFFTLFSPEIISILTTKDYSDAVELVPPIASGVFLISITNVYSNILIYLRKTSYIVYSTGTAAALNVLLNYIGISRYGYKTAAYTTLISYALMALILGKIANRAYKNLTGNVLFLSSKRMNSIGIAVTGGCMLSLIVYKNCLFRYLYIAGIIFIGFLFRKKVLSVIKMMKNNDVL